MAIVSDGFLHIGGAEKVLLELVALYPKADLFIPIINQQIQSKLMVKTQGKIRTTFFSRLPFFYQHASWLKPLLIFYWESLNLSEYQFVISSSHSFNSKLVKAPAGVPHLSYVHTPPRYLSKHFSEIKLWKNPTISWLTKPLFNWLKTKDQLSGKRPTLLIANSDNVKQRIRLAYHRPSLVVYPPVEVRPMNFKPLSFNQKKYYLCFSRLVRQKGLDLAVKALTKLDLPLVVVGTGPELNHLKKIAGPKVTFLGFVDDKKLVKIFAQAKALINCAREEDFGMVTVEAASHGLPVIAYRSGGLKETVLENKTGVFFDQHTVESLMRALKKFEQMTIKPEDCSALAQQFSKHIFRKKIVTAVNHLITHD